MGILIGVDIGGTSTDLMLVDSARQILLVDKLLTTPAAPEEAVFAGIERLLAKASLSTSVVGNVMHVGNEAPAD